MRVLVAEDEVVSRRLIESSLRRWGYDVVLAKDGLEALRIMTLPDGPQLAVLDWLMPGLDGLQLCRAIRERKSDPYTYILLLTVKHCKDDIVAGLEAGADDYIAKPFEPQEFRVRLRTGKRILCLLEQLTTARETLRDLAAHDSLTGLWNHNSIIELLGSELSRAERQGACVGVALADIDHFKAVNDSYGHLVGDRLLCEAAEAMRSAIRPYDAIGRYGGEEFLIILPGCDQMNAISHSERLRQSCSNVSTKAGDKHVSMTASFGVTVVPPGCRVSAEAAILAADAALYAAKRNGRNRVEFLAPTPDQRRGREVPLVHGQPAPPIVTLIRD